MTSCGGMVSVMVRRSTLTIRSTTGISRKRPGPFGSGRRRPSRKTIPRSYSRATLIAEIKKRTSRKRTTTRTTTAAVTARILLLGEVLDVEREVGPDSRDADPLARPERSAVSGCRTPELAVHEDEVVAPCLADLADDG